jgi:hypothetical protein
MTEALARRAAIHAELTAKITELRPAVNALGGSIRGMGVGLPFDASKPPHIYVDLAFPPQHVVERVHEILRPADPNHKVIDVTRTDAQIEV